MPEHGRCNRHWHGQRNRGDDRYCKAAAEEDDKIGLDAVVYKGETPPPKRRNASPLPWSIFMAPGRDRKFSAVRATVEGEM
jgi:hypothetical protein